MQKGSESSSTHPPVPSQMQLSANRGTCDLHTKLEAGRAKMLGCVPAARVSLGTSDVRVCLGSLSAHLLDALYIECRSLLTMPGKRVSVKPSVLSGHRKSGSTNDSP